ncbi:MAG: murein biosynthesis integral membrane protein MurJ [Actinobacteria bacterium]|nr:murein biosynthesis integral membrane protein MurJ [Actinomycetota bacterium]MBT3746957.1 murein biosynthesis integral membrane protein MurJ [Actinomycetota bacterium]MBT3970509.1 murein biosynthesis integral membrane protein MurJ [Actinomycetota bacterium]MBT4008903.1 murein biosynthesis integral membrane protein MurJ [Actinomycetota bacterium]MBT4302766.1 murein biosynthesis integral membrane protein MurJ [Actinomycetota bacterium]
MPSSATPSPRSTSGAPRGASAVAAGIFLSRLSGLVRESLLRSVLALGPAADAFAAALRIPNILQNLLGEGSLSASFIPVYSRLLSEDKEEEAARVAGAVAGLLAALAGLFAVIAIFAARPLTALLTPGFSGQRFELTVDLMRITTAGAGILVVSAWCLGVLNSHRQFFLSYVAPVLWNIAQIAVLAAALFGGWDPVDAATGVAWGLVVGGLLQFGVQAIAVRKLLPGLRPTLQHRLPGVAEIRRRFLPAVAGRGVVQLSAYLDLILASFLATGALAALMSAQVLYLLPISLFAMSVAAAELPEMSRTEDQSVLISRVDTSLRRTSFFVVFSAVAYLSVGEQIVSALFGWGAFSADDTRLVWLVLGAYSLGLPAIALSRQLQNTCYALGDTAGPARIAGLRVGVSAVIGLALMFPLDNYAILGGAFVSDQSTGPHLGAVGLALGSAVAAFVEAIFLIRLLRRSLPALPAVSLIFMRLAPAAALAFVVAAGLKLWLIDLPALLAAPLIVGFTGLLYTVTAQRTGVAEAHLILGPVRRRIWRS